MNHFTLFVVALLITCLVLVYNVMQGLKECEQQGGLMVRTMFSIKCIEATEIELQ